MSHVLAMDMEPKNPDGEFFDRYGCRRPSAEVTAAVTKADSRNAVPKRAVYYPACFRNARDAFDGHMETPPPAEFEDNCGLLQKMLKQRDDVAEILNGPCLPWAIPRVTIEYHGSWVESVLLGIFRAYTSKFQGRSVSRLIPGLQGNLSVVSESRQQFLLMRLVDGPVYGLYFPTALQGYSVLAQREQMTTLPPGFVLSGPEALFAMATHAETLFPNMRTPVYSLSAYQRQCGSSLLLCHGSRGLIFDAVLDMDIARGTMSGGLSFVGF